MIDEKPFLRYKTNKIIGKKIIAVNLVAKRAAKAMLINKRYLDDGLFQ
jgi:hypothetical protein